MAFDPVDLRRCVPRWRVLSPMGWPRSTQTSKSRVLNACFTAQWTFFAPRPTSVAEQLPDCPVMMTRSAFPACEGKGGWHRSMNCCGSACFLMTIAVDVLATAKHRRHMNRDGCNSYGRAVASIHQQAFDAPAFSGDERGMFSVAVLPAARFGMHLALPCKQQSLTPSKCVRQGGIKSINHPHRNRASKERRPQHAYKVIHTCLTPFDCKMRRI